MIFERKKYLDELIAGRGNGLVKIVTGVRRCGNFFFCSTFGINGYSLLSINDHFRKVVIVGDDIHRKEDDLGVLTIGLLDFLMDKKLLEQG